MVHINLLHYNSVTKSTLTETGGVALIFPFFPHYQRNNNNKKNDRFSVPTRTNRLREKPALMLMIGIMLKK